MSQNLIPNPSFEDTLGCPQFYPDLDGKCANWMSFRITPDYMNNCSSVCGYYNQYGYQQPHSGNAYAGIAEYHVNLPNTREHIGVQLPAPVIIGTKYYISFFVSPGFNYITANIACNKIGALVTTYQYSDPTGSSTLPNASTIKTDSIIADTLNWYQVFGSFTADSAYQYLVIGNWFDDNNIDTIHFPNQFGNFYSYYYLDDVCLSADSLYAQNWTGIQEQVLNQNNVKIYPNPASGNLKIKSGVSIKQIEIINSLGQIVFTSEEMNGFKINLSVDFLKSGIYLLRLKNVQGFYNSTLIIN